MDAASDMGPLCNEPHWQDVCTNTDRAIAEGVKPLTGGSAPNRAEDGFFYRPTILGDVAHKSVAGQEEIFGPVLSVLEYDDFDQALHMQRRSMSKI